MVGFVETEVRNKDVQIHGAYDPRFAPVADALRKQVAFFGGGGAASVYLEGRCVVDIWGGQARKDGSPWARDTMSICFSGTKGVAATAVHMLVSDGLIDYDAPVSRYWPEFGCNGKEDITVRQLLAHQAGLHRAAPLLEQLTDILDWDCIVSRLADAEPEFRPGSTHGYHALTFGWLVGELVRRVSGMGFSDFVRKRIVAPLQLDGLYVGDADSQMDRLADLVGLPALQRNDAKPLPTEYAAPSWVPRGSIRNLVSKGITPGNIKELYSHPAFWKASIPSMNGVCTARSLAKMYAALSMGGTLDGVRLVDDRVVAQSAEVQMKRPDKVVMYPLHWRLGYHRADAFVMNVPSAFGHFGVGGAGGWANPELRLSAALSHNGFPLSVPGQARTTMLTAAVYESLGLYGGVRHTLRRGQMLELVPTPVRARRPRIAPAKDRPSRAA